MDWLKTILENEELNAEAKATEIQKELPKHFKPAKDFNAKNEALKTANTKISEMTEQLETLSKSTGDIEQLKKDLAEAKTNADTYKAEAAKKLSEYKIKSVLRTQLLAAKADPNYVDLLEKEFDIGKAQLTEDESKIIGFDDMLKPVQERRSIMFGSETSESEATPNNPNTEEIDTDKLDDKEYYKRLSEGKL